MDFKSRYKYNTKEDLLGKGGFSRVFRATDVLLERDVALKVFNSEQSARYDLITEIKKVIKFQHDNLCRYYDVAILQTVTAFGEEEQVQVGVMELLNGGELKKYLAKNPQYLNKLLEDVLQGLSYLHKKNIIHRDLKPQNILIKLEDDGPVAKITDFGISKAIDDQGDNSSALLGTVEYMAPEQFNPQKYGIDGQISTHIDLWSFGIMVYELLAGQSLFGSRSHGTSAELVMRNILGEEYLEKLKTLPAPYNEIASQCLVKEASKRVRSADVLLEILRKSYNGNNSFSGQINGLSGNGTDETLVLNLDDLAETALVNDLETQVIPLPKPEPAKPTPVAEKPVLKTPEPVAKITPPAVVPKPETPKVAAPAAVIPKAETPSVEAPKPVAQTLPPVAPKPVETPPQPKPAAPQPVAVIPEPIAQELKPAATQTPKPAEPVKAEGKAEPVKTLGKDAPKPTAANKETLAPEAPKVGQSPKAVAGASQTPKPAAATPNPEAKSAQPAKPSQPEKVAVPVVNAEVPGKNPAQVKAAPKNNKALVGIAAGAALLLLGGGGWYFSQQQEAAPTPAVVETAAVVAVPEAAPEITSAKTVSARASASENTGKSGAVTNEILNFGGHEVTFTGTLKNGKPEGPGEQKFGNGAVYTGNFLNGNYHQAGTLTLKDGSTYELQWNKGKALTATFNYSNGNVYKGGFTEANGTFTEHGKGALTWADGDKYVGSWVKGNQTNGTFYYKDGSMYKGDFAQNKKAGKGKFLYPDGARYEGEFRNDAFNGPGKKYNADGELTESGVYKNGELVKSDQ